MYQDAGYGENWQPEGNNARRLDPYNRSCVVLSSFFAIGFVLIIIVVLSLIPIYISHNSSSTNSNIQTSRVSIINYNLQFESSIQNFDSQTILTDSNNRQALQASLTTLLQKDSNTAGSVVEISTLTKLSNVRREKRVELYDIVFNLNITSNRTCTSTVCSNQFYSHVNNSLTSLNKITSCVRYQQTDSSESYCLYYQLPQKIQSVVLLVYDDPKRLSALLDTLMAIDQTSDQPTVENSTSFLLG